MAQQAQSAVHGGHPARRHGARRWPRLRWMCAPHHGLGGDRRNARRLEPVGPVHHRPRVAQVLCVQLSDLPNHRHLDSWTCHRAH